jgi:ubiquinone/menaquinone biosynthesis C-methylase UbiE
MDTTQKKIFIEEEANNWFRRNLNTIKQYDGRKDPVVRLIERYHIAPEKILEVGCSACYRLAFLKNKFKPCRVLGVDPSDEAIRYGKDEFRLNDSEICTATADQLSHIGDHSVDLVIMGFVFYVIDRSLLLKVIAEIDRILVNKGALIIIDFFAPSTRRNAYHHIKSRQVFSYKQKYPAIFESSGVYHLIAKDSLDHMTKEYSASDDFYNKYTIDLLKKDTEAAYQ